MSQAVHAKPKKCSRCDGSGRYAYGTCFNCEGLGIASKGDYSQFKRNVSALVLELGRAEQIILNLLDSMTDEQKAVAAEKFAASDIAEDCGIRSLERRAILAAFDA